MADFTTSTHRAKWIFSTQELMEKYKAANQRARQMLEKYGTTRIEVNVDGSMSYSERRHPDTKDGADKHSHPKPLKVEDEQLMRAWYEFKLQDVCDAFSFPPKIQATALIYFKRFYLQWSVMEHHPKDIMLTCVYAACKVEENHVSAEELGKGIEQDHHVILSNEMLVLQSLGFDLIVYTPYRAIEGFINDMEDFIQANDDRVQMLKDLHQIAKVEADKIMRTDAPLLFPPGQLALAALRRSNELCGSLDFVRYLSSVLSRHHSMHTISDFTSLYIIDSLSRFLILCYTMVKMAMTGATQNPSTSLADLANESVQPGAPFSFADAFSQNSNLQLTVHKPNRENSQWAQFVKLVIDAREKLGHSIRENCTTCNK